METDIMKLILISAKEKITIDGITLLSIEEYEKYKENIPLLYRCWWWLRSPGYDSDYAASVDNEGSADYFGYDVNYDYYYVRPALKISNHNLKIKDEFIFKNYKWTVISEDLTICNSYIGRHCFRKDWEVENPNDYEASDIKKYIEDWLNEE